MQRVVHFLSGLTIGGKERIALKLARRGRREGWDHRLLVYDSGFRNPEIDLDPGDVPVELLRRRPGLDLRFASALARRLQDMNVAAVHAHNDSALVYGVMAVRRIRGNRPRLVATFHTRPSHPTLGARLLSRWAAKRADVVTAVSPDLQQFLQSKGWVGACAVAWNGVDLQEYSPDGPTDDWRARLDIPERALVVAHVGRFHPVKRQQDLLAAARLLRDSDPPLVFVFVGHGPDLDKFATQAGDAPNVRIVRRVHDMGAFYRATDLFVLCSVEECAPLVLLEAMGCARPIVCTDIGSLPFIVGAENGPPCAKLVPPRQPDAMARAIADLTTDPSALRELGRRARLRAEWFSEDREWRRYLRLYQREATERSAAGS